MDFRYTEEQLALQDTLQRFISRDYDFERRRALVRSPLGFSAEAWAQLRRTRLAGAALAGGIRRARRQRRRCHGGDGAGRARTLAGALLEHRRVVRRTGPRCGLPAHQAIDIAADCRGQVADSPCRLRGARGAMISRTSDVSLSRRAADGDCRAARRWCSTLPRLIIFSCRRAAPAR